MIDEKEEKNQESSPEENETEESKVDESGESVKEDDKPSTVPYNRFQEVVKERNQLKEQMEGKEDKSEKSSKDSSKNSSKDTKKAEPKMTDAQWKEKVDFLISNKDVNENEVDFISSYAVGKGIGMQEAYEKKDVKDYLKFQREQAKQEKAAPEPSNSGETFNKKSLNEVPKEELRSNFHEIASKAIKQGKNKKKKDLGL